MPLDDSLSKNNDGPETECRDLVYLKLVRSIVRDSGFCAYIPEFKKSSVQFSWGPAGYEEGGSRKNEKEQ